MAVDFHAHILPGMDHGCEDEEVCVRQLKAAKKAGVDTVVAASHFYPHMENVESFLKRREEAWEKVRTILSDRMPRVLPGAEVLLWNGMDRMEELQELCIRGTDILLVEMPFASWEKNIWDTLVRLEDRKELKIVLAHIERYCRKDRERVLQAGYPVQVNSSFLRTLSGKRTVKAFLERGLVAALGSDIHGADRHYCNYKRACAWLRKRGCREMADTERRLRELTESKAP